MPTDPAPHGGTGPLFEEHEAVESLVTTTNPITAVRDGEWGEPSTWGGLTPIVGADILIPSGLTVSVRAVDPTPLRTIRVDGTLRFDSHADSGLFVDTLVVLSGGALEIGAATDPVEASRMAVLTFTDTGAIDTRWDPYRLSRGLISHGRVRVHGAAVTPFLPAISRLVRGATQITLSEAPIGWRTGDKVVLTGTAPGSGGGDELFTITALSGATITLDRPLQFDHPTPLHELHAWLANLSRNVVFRSQSRTLDRRGHVMFMHASDVLVEGAGFYDLGRTDKAVPINDPVVQSGVLTSGTGTNPRGRYSLHCHRTGIKDPANPVKIRRSVVWGSPGWGFVNHSGNVDFEDDVAYDVTGAAFASEAGDEIGSFRSCLAVRTTGSGAGIEARLAQQDFGHEGYGFWFQGGGVAVVDNVAAGHRAAGFIFYLRGLDQRGLGVTEFLVSNLTDPSWAAGKTTVKVEDVPIRRFEGNEAFACTAGMGSYYHLLSAPHSLRSTFEGARAWSIASGGVGVFLPYTNRMTIKDALLLGDASRPAGMGVNMTNATGNIEYLGVRAEGWAIGIQVPMQGTNRVIGGSFRNATNFAVPTAFGPGRVVSIEGATLAGLSSTGGLDVALDANLDPGRFFPHTLFGDDTIRMVDGSGAARQLYFNEQAPGFVPFPVGGTVATYLPTELRGKTNQQIWDEYGIAIGGALASTDAAASPRLEGLIGAATEHLSALTLVSPQQTPLLQGYQLIYGDASGAQVIDPTPVTLRSGWNLVTRLIGGRRRSFFVFSSAIEQPVITPATNAGTFEFEFTTLTVREDMGSFSVRVRRVGGSSGVASVTYATRDETTQPGLDVVSKSGVLTFQNGETEKTLSFSLVDDRAREPLEQFRIVLSNPTGGALLNESLRRIAVSIVDND